jgi:hypothetical protein
MSFAMEVYRDASLSDARSSAARNDTSESKRKYFRLILPPLLQIDLKLHAEPSFHPQQVSRLLPLAHAGLKLAKPFP